IGGGTTLRIEAGIWYDIRIEVSGRTIRCYLNGELIHDVVDEDDTTQLYLVCSYDEGDNDVIIKAVNRSSVSRTVEVRLAGSFKPSGKGTAEVLTSDDLDDENSFVRPFNIAPVVTELTELCSKFEYTFKPYSVTVLRIKGT
ncbi:MAG: alpha-L-arabinofuranosidase C-terminal domain-containing protein, partial [Bacillota bacterium]